MTPATVQRKRRPGRRRPVVRALLVTAAFIVVFALGMALGQVTSSDGEPGTAVTRIRTIVPVAATQETVTVTTTVTSPP